MADPNRHFVFSGGQMSPPFACGCPWPEGVNIEHVFFVKLM